MVKFRKSGQIQLATALGLCCLLATGCSQTPTTAAQNVDPLTGVRTPPSTVAPPAHSSSTPTSTPSNSQTLNQNAPLAIPTASNPATLAGSSWQGPLGTPQRIDDNRSAGPPFFSTSGSKSQTIPEGWVPPNPNPKVEQVPDVNPTAPKVTAAPAWQTPAIDPSVKPASVTPATNENELAQLLRQRGVQDQKVDQVPEGLRLTCYISRGPGGGLRILEVTAADYPTAAQAILKQLDGR